MLKQTQKRLSDLEERARILRGEPLIVEYTAEDGTTKRGTVEGMLSTVGYGGFIRIVDGDGVDGLVELLDAMVEFCENYWRKKDAKEVG